ncbi:Putative motility protein [Ectothiorhodospira magna]|uniref:Putative motility protein n=1 Tax=Ectothiorhodospira magna TaxID=867345 RepID=A0A1H9FRR3_9GAMM|nr:YjfB family protein [Ectothiorhodospira magna]SEQ40612.1 Putative motility protein [Ectothiorhodospira magna]
MDVNAVANLATQMSQQQLNQDLGMAVLKKAMDTQAQSALALVEALPDAGSTALPPNLGNTINTTA